MGAIVSLTVDGFEFIDTRNNIIPELMTVFSETDRRTRERQPDPGTDEPDDEASLPPYVEYVASVKVVKDRLNVLGFSLRNVESEFEKLKLQRINELREGIEESAYDSLTQELETLAAASFQGFLAAFRQIKEQRLPFATPIPSLRKTLVQYMLDENNDYYFGFPASDLRSSLRVILECCPDSAEVVQDITELLDCGYYDEDAPLCEIARRGLTADYPRNAPILVLTEGSTDADIIGRSLRLLYPHLAGYYFFMDFGDSRAPGGVGALVATIKAFVAAGIANRVIALFDNDTAAAVALRGLGSIVMPAHFRVFQYPPTETTKSYPTIGPTGMVDLDISGLACSLELYFGTDVLTTNGTLLPVQWRGYDEGLKRYQGEILDKRILHAKMLEKLRRCEEDPAGIDAYDWEGMRAILQLLLGAYT